MDNDNKLYKINKLKYFYLEYNLNEKDLIDNKHFYYRFLCYYYIDFIRNVELPSIPIKSDLETVLIEYRCFPHLEFLIRNTIFKLGNKWSHTIVCGNQNYEYMYEMCNKISPNIKIIQTDHDILTPSSYHELLSTTAFWKLFDGKKILIYHEDTIIFKKNINDFLDWDYISSSFSKSKNDIIPSVDNSGISLRTKDIMIEIIKSIGPEETIFDPLTIQYMKDENLTFPPEDIYFSKNMQDFSIGKLADFNSALNFSSENIIHNHSFAGDKFWMDDDDWINRFKNNFFYKEYLPNSNIIEYLKYILLDETYNKTSDIPNAFDVDLYFCNYVNEIIKNYNNKNINHRKNVMEFIKNKGLKGNIYHTKQIKNIFPDINIYHFLNKIVIEYNLNIYDAKYFVNKYLYDISYETLFQKLIKNKYENFDTNCSLLLLVFIGNEKIGHELMNKILDYKKIQEFNISFCFNCKTICQHFKSFIRNNFTYYSIYLSNQLGTDITSTLLMYDSISRNYHFEHIIKLQTKSIENQFHELTNYLLHKPLNELLLKKNKKCNCIGAPKYYMYLNRDMFNRSLLAETKVFLNRNNCFVFGTIFYCPNKVFKETFEFMKKTNVRSYFLNNLYENNMINKDYSPIHFLERVFGIVRM